MPEPTRRISPSLPTFLPFCPCVFEMPPRFDRRSSLPFCLALLLGPGAALGADIDFARDVRPLLEAHCYRCHGAEKQKSGLRLDVKSAAFRGGSGHAPDIVPGDPSASPLFQFVSGSDPDLKMPPEGDGLAPDEVATIKAWIAAGAPWPDGIDTATLEDRRDHWAFRPIASPAPPRLKPESVPWVRDQLDAFILADLEARGLSPAPAASPLTWLRRVTLDLTGLPPSPEETRDFLATVDQDAEAAYHEVVERLLASPRHGERWAQHWLDVVRYADTHGFEVNTERPHAWPYRDYVIESLNADLPFDQFVREQLAGDVLGADPATGFLVTAAALLPGQIGKDDASKRLARQDELSEIVINTGEAFLGLSVGCARCHDHKFDPISAEDFYAMQAFFAGVRYGDRPIEDAEAAAEIERLRKEVETLDYQLGNLAPVDGGEGELPPVNAAWNIDRFSPVTVSALRFRIETTNKLHPCLDELEIYDETGRNVALASRGAKARASGSNTSPGRHELRFLNDGVYGNSRSWMSNAEGKGWVEIEFPRPTTIDRVAWGRDRLGKFQDRLPLDYQIEIPGPEGTWKTVASSNQRTPLGDEAPATGELAFPLAIASLSPEQQAQATLLRKARNPLFDQLAAHPGARLIYAGVFGEPESIHLLTRGDPEQPRHEIAPATIAFLGDHSLPGASTDTDRRLALGRWITSPENPLTARVIVNRIWQWHFGIGFVETANDFGQAGALPSHPALLDHLASELVASGWSLKSLHRRIVLSATYRQSNRIDPAAEAIDRDARFLWRFPSRRLEAEAIRDSMVATSGRLNLEMGGRGFDLFKSRGGLSGFPPVQSFQAEGLRRMIYAHRIRMEREIVFGAFDCPDAGQSLPRRRQSTTPIQALNLFNSQFTHEESEALARRITQEVGEQAKPQVSRAWLLVYQRPPTMVESEEATALVREHGLATLCRALFNSNEFLFLP